MALACHRPHFHIDVHHPFWLWVAMIVAFLLAALWATPIG
jgi:hypothetical protein